MAKASLEFLSREEIEKIHGSALRVLDGIGIDVRSDSVKKLLVEAGAREDKKGRRLFIDEEMTEEALANVPKSILLAGRDRKHDITIPSPHGRMFAATGGSGVYIKDLLTGAIRDSSLDDLRKIAAIADRMPQIDFFWPLVSAVELPQKVREVLELKSCFEFTGKHVQGEAMTAQEANHLIDLAGTIVGGREALAKRPIFSSVHCPISPLTFEKGLVEAQVEMSKAGIPVVAMSASMAGLTSPVTISGTLVQVTAENLASLVISQAASRGSPWIFSSDSSAANLKTGGINYLALETPLLRAGAGQMGRHFGLPTMVSGDSIENVSLSLGSVTQGVPLLVLESILPSDLASGMGGIDDAAGASFEQILVDAWIWEIAQQFVRGFDFDDEAISLETIREAAKDGNFLNKRHTLTRFKKEFCGILDVDAKFGDVAETPKSTGSLVRRAREEVEAMLRELPGKPTLQSDAVKEMDRFVESLR